MTALTENPSRLLVAETFTSLQGEGPSAGQPATFIRLSRCNMWCTYCDTPYTWDWSRYRPEDADRRTGADLAGWAESQPARLIVITGGEPLLQQQALAPLVTRLAGAGHRIEVETNGTIAPVPDIADGVTQFNVSPKLSGSGVPAARRIVSDALTALAGTGKGIFKFVISDPAELAEVRDLETRFGLAPVWIMPEGTSEKAVLAGMRALEQAARTRGWSLSSRLHILLWGDQRGR